MAGCAVVTGVGAVVNVAAAQGSVAGRPMLVLGAGGVGLSAVMGAHLVGAAPVVVVDVARDKLDLAQSLGATDVVDASQVAPDELVGALQALTGGGAEVAIDAVGSPATMAQAFAALRPGGTVIAVGLSSTSAAAAVPINELVQQQKHLVGSLYGSANPSLDLPRLLALYRTRPPAPGQAPGGHLSPRRGAKGVRRAEAPAPWAHACRGRAGIGPGARAS